MQGRHLLGPVPSGKHSLLLFQAFSKENTCCAKLREHQSPQNKHILQVKSCQQGEKQTDITVMKSHASSVSANSSEHTCHVAFLIRGVRKLLWLSAAFVFMGSCVRFVTKLKSQPRFSWGTQTWAQILLSWNLWQNRTGVLPDKIHRSLNSLCKTKQLQLNGSSGLSHNCLGVLGHWREQEGTAAELSKVSSTSCTGAAHPAGLSALGRKRELWRKFKP